LGLNEQQGHQETKSDSTSIKDTAPLDSITPREAQPSSTVTLAQNEEFNTSSRGDPTMPNIRDLVTEKLSKSSTDPNERLLIRSSLKDLLDSSAVKRFLKSETLNATWLDKVDIQKLADFITDRALSVFAVLIKMGKPDLIKTFFQEEGFEESMLPIKYRGPMSGWSVESYFSETSNPVLQKIFTSDAWQYADVADFCELYQWNFFPLVFTKERFYYTVPSNMRLPYAPAHEALETTHSNYSRVEKKSIYRECFESNIVRNPV
jgi:hypothetical protein